MQILHSCNREIDKLTVIDILRWRNCRQTIRELKNERRTFAEKIVIYLWFYKFCENALFRRNYTATEGFAETPGRIFQKEFSSFCLPHHSLIFICYYLLTLTIIDFFMLSALNMTFAVPIFTAVIVNIVSSFSSVA